MKGEKSRNPRVDQIIMVRDGTVSRNFYKTVSESYASSIIYKWYGTRIKV